MKWWPLQTRKGLKVVVGLHPWQDFSTNPDFLMHYHKFSLSTLSYTVSRSTKTHSSVLSELLYTSPSTFSKQASHLYCSFLVWSHTFHSPGILSRYKINFNTLSLGCQVCHLNQEPFHSGSIHCRLHLLLTNPLHFLISYLSPIYPIILSPHFLHS